MKDNTVALSALGRLKEGNKIYINSMQGVGDISPQIRKHTCEHGQHPFAVIVSCSDSRVIPESIFSVGIGDLFVIRVAGNVVGDYQMGSIQYAVEHLGCKLVVVLGHTCCGAVGAALHNNDGFVKLITDEIKHAIGDECDTDKAAVLNVKQSVTKIEEQLPSRKNLLVTGALYHTDTGLVDFL